MREMKDSGIQWAGLIPNDWSEVRLRDYYVFEKGKNAQKYTVEYIGKNEGNIPVYSGQTDNDGVMGYVNDCDYDVESCLFSTTVGAKAMSPKLLRGKFCLSQNCLIMKSIKEIDNSFMFYELNPLFDFERHSIPQYMQPSLRIDDLNKFIVLLPSLEEQHRISAYLDAKCSEIDALTADIQSQVDTLEQYKRSVITEAVTKGLDKNAEMVDSGIPWIGKIPATWSTDKIKYHLLRTETRNRSELPVLSVYREYGVIPKDSRNDNHNVTSEDTSKYKYVRPGFLVINKMKAWQGSMGVSKYEGIVSPAYFIYRFTDNMLNKWYIHYLLRNCYKDEFRRISGGIREGQWDLPDDGFENEYIPIPPKEVQEKIVDYIKFIAEKIDKVVTDKQHQLALLDSYKKSLIYEYVTGKKEVPSTWNA